MSIYRLKCRFLISRVVDPHHFNADPDPAVNLNVDPDPAPHQNNVSLRPLALEPPGIHFEPPGPWERQWPSTHSF
jgi:hypothetical protein